MKFAVLFADGFEEIEAFSAVSVLRRAGMSVDMVGAVGSVVSSGHGARVMMDARLNSVRADSYDGVVIPGGSLSCDNLVKNKPALDFIRAFYERGKIVAAICCAPKVLLEAGVLENVKATIYPGMEKDIPYPRNDAVVVDRNVITSKGPGTALEFSLAIVEAASGKAKAAKIRKDLVL